MFRLIVMLTVCFVLVVFGLAIAQQIDRCTQAQQDGQKRINENIIKMGNLKLEAVNEINRCSGDIACINKAGKRYGDDLERLRQDNENIRAGWIKTCNEEQQRQREMQVSKQIFAGKRSEPGKLPPRDPFQPPVRFQ